MDRTYAFQSSRQCLVPFWLYNIAPSIFRLRSWDFGRRPFDCGLWTLTVQVKSPKTHTVTCYILCICSQQSLSIWQFLSGTGRRQVLLYPRKCNWLEELLAVQCRLLARIANIISRYLWSGCRWSERRKRRKTASSMSRPSGPHAGLSLTEIRAFQETTYWSPTDRNWALAGSRLRDRGFLCAENCAQFGDRRRHQLRSPDMATCHSFVARNAFESFLLDQHFFCLVSRCGRLLGVLLPYAIECMYSGQPRPFLATWPHLEMPPPERFEPLITGSRVRYSTDCAIPLRVLPSIFCSLLALCTSGLASIVGLW